MRWLLWNFQISHHTDLLPESGGKGFHTPAIVKSSGYNTFTLGDNTALQPTPKVSLRAGNARHI